MQGLNNEATEEELGVVKVGAQEVQTKCISDSVPGKKQWNFDNSIQKSPGRGQVGIFLRACLDVRLTELSVKTGRHKGVNGNSETRNSMMARNLSPSIALASVALGKEVELQEEDFEMREDKG